MTFVLQEGRSSFGLRNDCEWHGMISKSLILGRTRNRYEPSASYPGLCNNTKCGNLTAHRLEEGACVSRIQYENKFV
jgi:hypothetical protein